MKKIFLGILVAWVFSGAALAETLELIRKIPHSGYSEGLDYYQNYLWHALPKALLKIDPADGSILERFTPPSDYSESLTWFEGKLWNVSYANNGLFTGNLAKGGKELQFKRVGEVPEIHAWGLAHDGKHILMTGDYSDKIYFIDPKTLKVARKITTPVKDLEDLAWDGTGIWSSSYTSHRGQIFRVDPATGAISNFFSIPEPESCPVIDGIAFDGKGLWVTGKERPSIFYLKRPTESRMISRSDKPK